MSPEFKEGDESMSCADLVEERAALYARMTEIDSELITRIERFLTRLNVEMGGRDFLVLKRGVHFEIEGKRIKINCEPRVHSIMSVLREKGLSVVEGMNYMALVVDFDMLD